MAHVMKKHWPAIVASVLLFLLVFTLLVISEGRNEGFLVYALDDAYIHMAMAKNFARHGVWGVTSHAFSPATSSVLWTFILSFSYLVWGAHDPLPFILNLVFAILVLVAGHLILDQFRLSRLYQFLLLLCLLLLTPLPVVIFVGMEHTAQILLDLLFAYRAARLLSKAGPDSGPSEVRWLLLLSALVPLIRYEGLFLIAVVCVLLLLRGRVVLAFASGAAAVLPVAVFGYISVREGAFWLPNSVLLKAADPARGVGALLAHAAAQLWAAPYLWQLLLLASLLYLARRGKGRDKWEVEQSLLLIFIFTTLLHVSLSLVQVWFYRYEAYLVALGIIACGLSLRGMFDAGALKRGGTMPLIRLAAFALLLSLSLISLTKRSIVSIGRTPQATTNIYQQQYQMARFLRDYYQGSAIAANDIGAINYLAELECLDLWGLATTEVARAKRAGRYNTQRIRELAEAKHARIAIVYDSWLDEYGGAPPEWVPVGRWRIPNNVVCRDDTVTFYAVQPSETEYLIESLREFGPRLPAGVGQLGMSGEAPLYALGRGIDFRAPESDKYLWYGWSGAEECCRWSSAGRAAIIFSLDEEERPDTLLLKIGPFLAPGRLDWQRVDVSLNGQPLASMELTEREAKIHSIRIPEGALRDRNVLAFVLRDATSPASLGLSDDARRLGINLEWLELARAEKGK
jgi:hypothetical protein